MNEMLAEVDAYFNGSLSREEKQRFEERIQTDQQLAEDVAFYIAARGELRAELLKNKVQEWRADDVEEKDLPKVISMRNTDWKKWLTGAVAAVFILFISVYFFETKGTGAKLADNFIKDKFNQLGHTMDGSTDSMQTGISLYNDGKFDESVKYFRQLYTSHPDNSEAKKYEGLAYYQQAKYDEAIESFSQLAAIKGQYSNPGHFLQAVALIKRNQQGDKEQAKQLLATVKSNNEEYSNEADEWLQKLK